MDTVPFAAGYRAPVPQAVLTAEAGGWSAFFPGLPVSASGNTLDEAVEDLVQAMSEYAEDWNDHLRMAPDHADRWALVQLVDLSTDEQLRDWLTARSVT